MDLPAGMFYSIMTGTMVDTGRLKRLYHLSTALRECLDEKIKKNGNN